MKVVKVLNSWIQKRVEKKRIKKYGHSRTIEPMKREIGWTLVHGGENEIYSVIPDVWDIDKRKQVDWRPSKMQMFWWKFKSLFIRKSKSRGKCL